MCNFLSGIVTLERNPRVLCADLLHHERTVEALGLTVEKYREWEWTRDDAGESLDVRAAPGENASILKSAILAKFPTRLACLNECIRQIVAIDSNVGLDLRSLTTAEGLTLPQSIGGGLDLPNKIRKQLEHRSLAAAKD